jgi:hypothetical protein
MYVRYVITNTVDPGYNVIKKGLNILRRYKRVSLYRGV